MQWEVWINGVRQDTSTWWSPLKLSWEPRRSTTWLDRLLEQHIIRGVWNMDVATVEPGYELDKRIVTEILGWQPWVQEGRPAGWLDAKNMYQPFPLRYSVNWTATMGLVQHLRTRHWCMNLEQREDGRWLCCFERGLCTAWGEGAATGPLAICRAALGAWSLGPLVWPSDGTDAAHGGSTEEGHPNAG